MVYIVYNVYWSIIWKGSFGMKKVVFSLSLAGALLVSSIGFVDAQVQSNSSGKQYLFTSEAELSDAMLDSLTVDDFAKAYEMTENDLDYKRMSESEQNKYITSLYVSIVQDKNKQDKITTLRYLPGSYKSLNRLEKKLVQQHPAQAAMVYAASKRANQRTQALYKSGLHNGNGDAFRHTYWNAELATMLGSGVFFNPNYGKAHAKKWTDAHEFGATNQPALERKMDLHNNKVGLNIVTKKMSSRTLERAALKKVKDGACKRISKGKLVKTTGGNRK